MKTFRPWQEKLFAYCRRRDRVALFAKMRLGKTLVAIRWASLEPAGRTLVVAPLSTLRSWRDELRDEGLTGMIPEGSTVERRDAILGDLSESAWYLTNYETIRERPDILDEGRWTSVILDECEAIKNPRSKTSKALVAMTDSPRRMLLGGTPAEIPEDYVQEMIWLTGSFMGCDSFWQWRSRYMVADPGGSGWHLKRGVADQIRDAVREDAIFMTTEQAGLKREKIHETRHVRMPIAIASAYRKIEKQWVAGDAETKWSLVAAGWLQELSSGLVPKEYEAAEGGVGAIPPKTYRSKFKTDELVRLLTTELADEKVLVWSRWTREIAAAAIDLSKAGVPVETITGQTPPEKRHELIERFRNDPRLRVLVVQSLVGRAGLDFSSASVMVFLSNWWEARLREQCEARCEHPDKEQSTLVVDIATEHTVDEDVLAALKRKSKVMQSFFELVRGQTRLRLSVGPNILRRRRMS